MQDVGGRQLSYMAEFWRALPWWTLEPDNNAIRWSSNAPTDSQRPFQKRNHDMSVVVAYLPQSKGSQVVCPTTAYEAPSWYGLVVGLNASARYYARWFNPRSNVFTPITSGSGGGDGVSGGSGGTTFSIPPHPNPSMSATEDWVFLLEEVKTAAPASTVGHHETTSQQQLQLTSWVTSVNIENRTKSRKVHGIVGCSISVAVGKTMTVHALGRYYLEGNLASETLHIYRNDAGGGAAGAGAGATVASVVVDMKLKPDSGGFVRAALDTPVVLAGNATYILASVEDGCDDWYDDMATTISTTVVASARSVYGGGHAPWLPGGGGVNHCYGPLNLYYT